MAVSGICRDILVIKTNEHSQEQHCAYLQVHWVSGLRNVWGPACPREAKWTQCDWGSTWGLGFRI